MWEALKEDLQLETRGAVLWACQNDAYPMFPYVAVPASCLYLMRPALGLSFLGRNVSFFREPKVGDGVI